MTKASLSHFTTPQELDATDNVDLQALLDGNEIRTVCCFRHVPYDCLTASCGHGAHQPERDDFPCIVYVPENHVLAHHPCDARRDRMQAVEEADRLWAQEPERTRQNPFPNLST